jgi:hypothetical protein
MSVKEMGAAVEVPPSPWVVFDNSQYLPHLLVDLRWRHGPDGHGNNARIAVHRNHFSQSWKLQARMSRCRLQCLPGNRSDNPSRRLRCACNPSKVVRSSDQEQIAITRAATPFYFLGRGHLQKVAPGRNP